MSHVISLAAAVPGPVLDFAVILALLALIIVVARIAGIAGVEDRDPAGRGRDRAPACCSVRACSAWS